MRFGFISRTLSAYFHETYAGRQVLVFGTVSTSAPRVHNQWLPDQVFVEPGLPDDVLAALQARGDKVVAQRPFTSANSIMVAPFHRRRRSAERRSARRWVLARYSFLMSACVSD